MNELEKTDVQEGQTATPAVSEQETANALPTENAEKTETVNEAPAEPAAVPAAEAETPAEPAAEPEAAAEEAKESAAPKLSEMSKEQLVASLRLIVEENRCDAHKEVAAIKQAFFNLRNAEIDAEMAKFVDAGNDPAAFAAMPDVLEGELKELLNAFKEKRALFLEAEEARRKENLAKKEQILERMKTLSDDIDKANVNFQEFQQLQNEFKEIKEIPATAETEIWKNYQQAVEQFYDHLKMNKELRDLDFKRNLDSKRQLIEEAKSLEADLETDIVTLFRKLQDLHLRWREIGPVAKELRDEIWDEFKAASTAINRRHQEFFEKRKAEEGANEAAKTALCEEVEAIDFAPFQTFKAWEEATDKIKDAQARWKQVGFASRKSNNALFNRFRQTCDKFFEAKAEFYKRSKEEFATNLAKKEALVAEAEGLKAMDDTRKAIERIVQLQAEWKKIGAVARKHSDAVWQRFQTACNYFFEERRKQNAETRQSENANLAQKREIIAELGQISSDLDRNEAVAKVKELQARWNAVGHVPFKMKDKLYTEYRAICDKLFEAYQIKESASRMNRYENHLRNLKGDDRGMNREREKLMRTLEAKKNEIQTFENNLGFFNVKSSAGSSMVADMERRIAKAREEQKEIEKKIALLDASEEAAE